MLSVHHSVEGEGNVPLLSRKPTLLMGLLDNLNIFGSFLNDRKGDFVKLDRDDSDVFGPGPALLLVDCPKGISTEEIRDMVEDGAPNASSKEGVFIHRVVTSNKTVNVEEKDSIFDKNVRDVFELIVENKLYSNEALNAFDSVISSSIDIVPLLYFSGFSNKEMLETYKIISREIFEETGGTARPACAKFVQPAAFKSLQQVIEEVRGDHRDAIRMNQ